MDRFEREARKLSEAISGNANEHHHYIIARSLRSVSREAVEEADEFIERLCGLLVELAEYFERYAGVGFEGGAFVPNEEMRTLTKIRQFLADASEGRANIR